MSTYEPTQKTISVVLPASWQSMTSLAFAGTCMQPIQGSNSCVRTQHMLTDWLTHLSTGHNLMNAAVCTCPWGRAYGWLRSTWALNVSKKSSPSVRWITTLGEFLMGARSFSRSSAYSAELSLERVGKTIWFLFVLTRDVPFCRDNTYLILNGVTAGLMLSTLRVRISVGEAESGLRWCCVDSVTVTWQSLCRAM